MIDVCLLLEGTYPYVAGGVSTWVHQLVTSMSDIRFGIVYIAPHSDPTRQIKYQMPSNVIYLKEVFLHDYNLKKTAKRKPQKKDYECVRDYYEGLFKNHQDRFPDFVKLFQGDEKCFDIPTFFSSKPIWEMLNDFCNRFDEDFSFLDFFWTWRGTHLPLIEILTAELPRARVYHAVSTGYAGLLGAIAKIRGFGKFFLTEHGIYTHERVLEISQANWIYEREKIHFRAEKDLSFFKRWWISIFKVMSEIAYTHSDQIFTLYEGNKLRQTLEGADENKITIIPNGIDVADLEQVQHQRRETPSIALIGRVVPIKDIKTFIHAAKHVTKKIPTATFYIIGPTDEEEEYADECRKLADTLGLHDQIQFTGRSNIKDYLKFVDVVVLTSISEAQPYVILEANIVGIPFVASDVGACREMIEGRLKDDRAMGPSGITVPVCSPDDTANAILQLLTDKEFYNKCSEAGKNRVRRYYDQDDLLSKYLNAYEQNL